MSHKPRKIDCPGANCNEQFKIYGGLLIHLEYGSCVSGLDHLDINKSAASVYQWKKFIDKDYRQEFLRMDDDYLSSGAHPFKCPECDKTFPKLSSLIQHVESPACEQGVLEWPIRNLLRWIYNKYQGWSPV